MDKRTFYCTFYIFLLTMSVPALCVKSQSDKEHAHRILRRFAVAPKAAYAGMAIIPADLRYRVARTSSDNHPCANNRGRCRRLCRWVEWIDEYHTDVCGYFKCCRSWI